jgi:mycothiol synthase
MLLRPAAHPADRPALERLFEEIERIDGYESLTEDASLAVEKGAAEPGLVATENGDVVGFAYLRRCGRHVDVETAIHPASRSGLARALLQSAVAAAGPGSLRLWASDDETVTAARDLGFIEERRLLHLVRPLPPPEPPRVPSTVEVTRFRPGRDVGALLEVHTAAFAGHPDDGGWTRETVSGRMRRQWFDPDGLFLAWEHGRPVGMCWTKMHPREVGEIYVIAIHPKAQGRSLSTGLVLYGLWDLHDRRGASTAMLYTEAANTPALRLYGRLGFEVLRVKRRLDRAPLSAR